MQTRTSADQSRHRLRGRAIAVSALVASLILPAEGARAAPYTFTLAGDLTGTIGGQVFSNDPFTWTVVGDPNAPTTLLGVAPALPAISDVITLGGIGVAIPTVPTYVAQSAISSAGGFIAVDGTQTPGIAFSAPPLAGPALTTPVPPTFASFNYGVPLPTTLGALDIANATNLVFSASGGAPPPPAITYSLTGFVSGSLGTTTFADQPFTWMLTASTGAPLTLPGLGLPALFASSDVLDVGGLGVPTPNEPFFAGELATASAAGFVTQASGQGLTFTSDVFAAYALGTSLDPVPVSFAGSQPIDTLSGKLTFTSAHDLTLSAALVTVPEPGSLAVLGVGLVGLGLRNRRPRAIRNGSDASAGRALREGRH